MNILLQIFPLFFSFLLFSFVIYVKKRRERFLNYLLFFKENGLIAKKDYVKFYNKLNSFVNYLNIVQLPKSEDLNLDIYYKDYDNFLIKSNRLGKTYIIIWGVSIFILFLLSLILR